MFKYYGKSTKSYLKEINQDALLVNNIISNDEQIKGSSKNENILFAIADGVGGSRYGEIASNFILQELAKSRNLLNHQLIINTIKNAHHYLIKNYSYNAQTVLSVVWIEKEKFTIYHIGDTRVYLITERNLIQLTNDHTYVQELVDKGIISNIMKSKHPNKNIITQSLGGNGELKIDIYNGLIEPGNKLLLTTDGIHDYVDDETIYKIIHKTKNLEKNINNLVLFAKENSSKDDISGMVAYYQ
ncbi:PP2C family protein-serine/threonine phosphatase [Aliarcobacter butzleri]|uniref:PP2C family protein-serine/threonine phosphatase n=1 Tax=Aliarcobacter butzleri TaxID=28197 RepID=UPI0021B27F4F|nr:PP2C family serine/threonine-protein phosphatase [Aliarcobacter butzleri]MCT7549086.1 protein phosphatase 2C domain-containing protein [Aliarcobacter butzleri]MCT7558396.1 protein phosphatase 2C domain-containing protein [Aliarcobacter butzleri]